MTETPRGWWFPPLLAVFVRLLLSLVLPRSPETFEYEEIARNLLAGRGYVLDHYMGAEYRGYSSGLLYTLITAGAHRIGSAAWLLPAFQYLVAAGTTLVVFHLARRVCAPSGACIAATLTAVHPALVFYDVYKRHPLGLDTLLFLGLVAALLARPSLRASGLTGLVLGLGILERPTLVPMLLLAPPWLVSEGDATSRRRRRVLFYSAAMLVVSPWLVRNTRVFGAPLLSTMTPEYLFMGNVPPSLGSYHLPSGELVLSAASPELLARLEFAGEKEQARVFGEAFRRYVSEQPARFVLGVGRKLVYFWTWAPQTGVRYPPLYRRLYLPLYVLLLVAALAGAVRARRGPRDSRRALGAMLALCALISGLHAVLCFELRHRWTLEPLLIVLAVTSVLPRRDRAPRSGGTGHRSDGGAPR